MSLQPRTKETLLIIVILCAYVALSLASAFTKRPWEDEASYANASYNLAVHGRMEITALELRGFVDHPENIHMYMQPPLHFLVTALWFKVFGFGVIQVRAESIAWGILALLALWAILRAGGIPVGMRLAVLAFASTDYFFLLSASDGRMDMMCTALGIAGIASYLVLRERHLPMALLVSHSLVAASGLTHPTGVIYLVGLGFLMLYYDRKVLAWKSLLIVGIPYMVGAVGWGWDILKDPQAFRAQLGGNLSGNAVAGGSNADSGIVYMLSTLKQEVVRRYAAPFGLGPGVGALNRLKGIVLVAYIAGLLSVFATKTLRRDKVLFTLAMLTAIYIVVMGLSPSKKYYYLANTTLPMATCLGLVLFRHPLMQRFGKKGVAAILVTLACLQVGGLLYRIRQDPYHKSYLPMTQVVRENADGDGSIMGLTGLWFYLYDRPFIQDETLGYRSGKKVDVVVMEPLFKDFIDLNQERCPECYQHAQAVLSSAGVVYEDGYYTIYKVAR